MIDFRDDANQRQIDRMVDGELSPLEQQSLLRTLDGEPDRWKDLALAYVEAQTMRDACRDWTRDVASQTVDFDRGRQQAVAQPAPSAWRWAATAIAGLCASIAVTFAAVHWWNRGTVAEAPGMDRRFTIGRLGRALPQPVANPLQADGDGIARREVDLPVVSAATLNPQRLYSAPPVITPELRNALRRSGHAVYEEQRIYPVVLKDGRRLLIPVNEIKVKYVGTRFYQ